MAYAEYWAKRALSREAVYRAEGEKTLRIMQGVYDRAFANIEKQVEAAERQLNKKGGLGAEDAAAYLHRLKTMEALQDNIYDELKSLENIERRVSAGRYAGVMREGYYRTMFDIQRGTGLAFDFALLPKRAIDEVMRAGWLGRNFSKSIWKNTEKLAGLAREIVGAGFLSGASIHTMVNQLDDVMQKGKFVSERLIRSETSYFANQGELRAYEQAGIEYYDYLATLDQRTSKVCIALDGETYRVDEAETGKNYPPMHAFCRSTTVAHFDDRVNDEIQRRARDPITGQTVVLDRNMRYTEWYSSHVKDKPQAEAAFYANKNRGADTRQFEKYRLIFGEELPANVEEFQKMKYTDSEAWERFKTQKQQKLNTMDYRPEFDHMFGNVEVRRWYIAHNAGIIDVIDKSTPLERQARQAHDLRNTYKRQAREMMADRAEAEKTAKKYPLLPFEHYFEKYSKLYGTEEDVYRAIMDGSTRTNKDVNRRLNLE